MQIIAELRRAQHIVCDLTLAIVASCAEISFAKNFAFILPRDGRLLVAEGAGYVMRVYDLAMLDWVEENARLLLPERNLLRCRLVASRLRVYQRSLRNN